jgi:hypothetical protein
MELRIQANQFNLFLPEVGLDWPVSSCSGSFNKTSAMASTQ